MRTTIRVPATTANLGPGFDSLGLALDLRNEFEFEMVPPEHAQSVEVRGFGADELPRGGSNLVLRAFNRVYQYLGSEPPGIRVRAVHAFPIGSGLGSSASAIAAGVLAAHTFAGGRFEALELAAEIEGHPDNVSAALLGGLTVSFLEHGRAVSVPVPVAGSWFAGVVVPEIRVTTAAMRAALPRQVPFEDAVFNLGRTALVVRAFTTGDEALLGAVMSDRLHQPVRLPLIAGAAPALEAARAAGAAAALSGAGPGLIAFSRQPETIRRAVEGMVRVFNEGLTGVWSWEGGISAGGAEQVTVTEG
jgi:homoserine kinase